MTILGLKLSRRLLAAVAISDEEIVFSDSRYAPSRGAVLESAMAHYFARLIDQTKPTAICYYAPGQATTVAGRLAAILEQQASERSVAVLRLGSSDLFNSLSGRVRTRRDLLSRLSDLCPALNEGPLARQLVLAEAILTALIGEIRQALPA